MERGDLVADEVWALLVRLALERVHRQLGACAAELDLAPTQAMALSELETERPLSMRELAARLKCDPSNITGLIDRLEARGLVRRQAHPSDRRVKSLVLTADGQHIRQRLTARIYTAPDCVRGLTEAEQRTLYQLLSRVLDLS